MDDDLTIAIDDELMAALTRLAKQKGCDVEELARRLLAEALRERRG